MSLYQLYSNLLIRFQDKSRWTQKLLFRNSKGVSSNFNDAFSCCILGGIAKEVNINFDKDDLSINNPCYIQYYEAKILLDKLSFYQFNIDNVIDINDDIENGYIKIIKILTLAKSLTCDSIFPIELKMISIDSIIDYRASKKIFYIPPKGFRLKFFKRKIHL